MKLKPRRKEYDLKEYDLSVISDQVLVKKNLQSLRTPFKKDYAGLAVFLEALEYIIWEIKDDESDEKQFAIAEVKKIRDYLLINSPAHLPKSKIRLKIVKPKSDDVDDTISEASSVEVAFNPKSSAKELLAVLEKEKKTPYFTPIQLLEANRLSFDSHQHFSQKNKTIDQYSKSAYEAKQTVYLKRQPSTKKKQGEENFMELAGWFLMDLANIQEGKYALVPMMAIVLNLFVHNSSYRPMQGQGKAQKRELEKLLYYYRSQFETHHKPIFEWLLLQETIQASKSYMPRNQAFVRMLKQTSLKEKFKQKEGKINAWGVKQTQDKLEGLGEMLAYTGARVNNFRLYQMALLPKADGNRPVGHMQRWLESHGVFKPTNHAEVFSKRSDLMKNLFSNFSNLSEQLSQSAMVSDIGSMMLKSRSSRAETLQEKLTHEALENIVADHPKGSSILVLQLYPKFLDKCEGALLRDTANYKQGLTNVLIGFYAGLLNYYASKKGLPVVVQRRQSFGFLSPTITDMKGLELRLSLGLEPACYDEVVVEATREFNRLLTEFDFTKQEDLLIKRCFMPAEKSKAKDKRLTPKTGRYVLKSVRTESAQWAAVLVSQKYLEQAEEAKSERVSSDAFKTYLEEYIVRRTARDVSRGKSSSLEGIKDFVYSFQLKKETPADVTFTGERPVIFNVLNNLLLLTVQQVKAFEQFDVEKMGLENVTWHILQKLYSNSLKAKWILDDLRPETVVKHHQDAVLLIENLQEYLIALLGVVHVSKTPEEQSAIIAALKKDEKDWLSRKLGISADPMSIYYTDSGQQSIVAALLSMELQFYGQGKQGIVSEKSVFVFPNSYFELDSFFEEVSEIKTSIKKAAKTVFIDVTHLEKLDLSEFDALQAVVIDVTHDSYFTDTETVEQIKKIHEAGKFVLLVGSSLKQEELGLDKYQSGRISVIPPDGKTLRKDIEEDLSAISKEAMDPFVASYIRMTHIVYGDRFVPGVRPDRLVARC